MYHDHVTNRLDANIFSIGYLNNTPFALELISGLRIRKFSITHPAHYLYTSVVQHELNMRAANWLKPEIK